MLTWTKYQCKDVKEIDLQARQQISISEKGLLDLEKTDARTYRNEKGVIIFIGGIIEKWQGTGILWSFFSKDAGRYLTQITRETKTFINKYNNYKRLEFYVDDTFNEAKRWATLLNFSCDGKCPAFFINGRDGLIYSRVNNNG